MAVIKLFEDRPFVTRVLTHFLLYMLLYIIIRIGYLIISKQRLKKDELANFIGMMYITFVLALTISPLDLTLNSANIQARIQLVPFDTVTRYWPLDGEYSFYNIIGNLLLMFPILPILTYSFKVKSYKVACFFVTYFVIFIEIMQLFFTTTRACDIDDFILNIIGFLLSSIIWRFLQRIKVVQ
jgi:VanZ like family.